MRFNTALLGAVNTGVLAGQTVSKANKIGSTKKRGAKNGIHRRGRSQPDVAVSRKH